MGHVVDHFALQAGVARDQHWCLAIVDSSDSCEFIDSYGKTHILAVFLAVFVVFALYFVLKQICMSRKTGSLIPVTHL